MTSLRERSRNEQNFPSRDTSEREPALFSFFPPLPRFPAKILGFVLFVKFLPREPRATSPGGNDVNDTHLNACWTGSGSKRMPRLLDSPTSKRNENVYCERGIYLAMFLLVVFPKILKILLHLTILSNYFETSLKIIKLS